MKSSTLLTVGALVLSVASSAHIGSADPQPAQLRRDHLTRHKLRIAQRPRVVDRVVSAARVEVKSSSASAHETEHRYAVALPAGCSRLIAIGGSEVRDIAIEVRGPRTMHMRQDGARGALEVISVCGTAPTRYEVTLSARSSSTRPALELRVRENG